MRREPPTDSFQGCRLIVLSMALLRETGQELPRRVVATEAKRVTGGRKVNRPAGPDGEHTADSSTEKVPDRNRDTALPAEVSVRTTVHKLCEVATVLGSPGLGPGNDE